MTSAPKSDKITAALGPAMKLAKSTTFSPEKMLSLAMSSLLNRVLALSSAPMEPWGALFKESGRAFPLVLGCGAEAKVGGLERQALALARFQSPVRCFERELDGNRRVGRNLLQDRFG